VATLARNGADIAIPVRIETDPAKCAQIKIQDEFELGSGEWFADTAQGVPIVRAVNGVGPILGVKSPNISAIRALFRSIILGTPGIVAVQELVVNYQPGPRKLSYSFAATLNTGAIITGGNAGFYVGGS
jgi:hypothetical protein